MLPAANLPLCPLLCHLFVQFNTDNTNNWNNTILPNSLKNVDFSVSYWLCVSYGRPLFFSPEDFESLASYSTKTDFFL